MEEPVTEAFTLAPSRPQGGWQTFRSLRHRDYRLLCTGTVLTSLTHWFQDLSISWMVYDMTRSPTLLGAVSGIRGLPLLFFSPWGGVAADRVDRRRLLLYMQVWLLFPSLAFAVTITLGLERVWHLFAFSLVMGMAWAFESPARHSLIPNLVQREEITNAVALNSAGFNMSRFVGPMIAGFLIASVGVASNFYIMGGIFLLVLLSAFLMRVPPRAGPAPSTSPARELLEGVRYVARRRSIKIQMVLALVPVLLSLPYISLMPIFAVDVYHVGAPGLGVMRSVAAIGAVAGTLALASLRGTRHKGLILLGLVTLLGVSLVLFALSPTYPLALAFLLVSGAAQTGYRNTNMALIQMAAEDAYRGRVMSLYLLETGLLPIGTLLAGFGAEFLDVRQVVLIMGLATIGLALLMAWAFPELRRMD